MRSSICLTASVSRSNRHQGLLALTGGALWGNGPQFDAHGMLTLLEVRERVAVPAHTDVLLAATAQRTAGEAEPEVLLEVTLRAVRQSCVRKYRMVRDGRDSRERAYQRGECGPWRAGRA